MGRMTILPGTTGITLTNAPKITMTDWERQLANLPGLRHVIDPAKLDAVGNGRDRFSGARITSKTPAVTSKIASDPLFNNLPVFNLSASTGSLVLEPGTVTPSFTFMAVALIPAAARASSDGKNLMTVFDGATIYRENLRSTSGALRFYSDNSDATANTINEPLAPPADVAQIYAISYDATLKQSGLLYSNATLMNLFTHAINPSLQSDSRWAYGGGNGGVGWIGKIGMCLIFDRAMHGTTLLPFMMKAVALLKQQYALS